MRGSSLQENKQSRDPEEIVYLRVKGERAQLCQTQKLLFPTAFQNGGVEDKTDCWFLQTLGLGAREGVRYVPDFRQQQISWNHEPILGPWFWEGFPYKG